MQKTQKHPESAKTVRLIFLNNHKNILLFLLHEELFAGIFLQVILVGGEFVKADGVLLNLLKVILPILLQLIDLP